jgi:hypothetical protein
MAVTHTMSAHADLRRIQSRNSPWIVSTLHQALDSLLHQLCQTYPAIPHKPPIGFPVYGPSRAPTAQAATVGDLEVQFQIVQQNTVGSGAVVEVLGFDWR